MSFEENFYENRDRWSNDYFGESDRERFATLADKLPIDVQTLLDVGCGNGLFLKHISDGPERLYKRLCGTDRSRAALEFVQNEHIRASIDALPFKNKEFDAVSCLEVIEHLNQKTYINALNELSRIARRYILVSVPFNQDLRMALTECTKCRCNFNPYYHLRSFSQQIMWHLFDDKGFICREVFYMHLSKDVPTSIEIILRLIGETKRALLQQPIKIMSSESICPACGFSPDIVRDESLGFVVKPKDKVGQLIRSLLSVKRGWKWVGALYERV